MAIISEKSFVNGALKNQNKKTKRPQTSIVNEADFLSRGGEERIGAGQPLKTTRLPARRCSNRRSGR